MANLKLAMVTAVLARNLEGGTLQKEILDSLTILQKAAGYMADASAESVKLSAKVAALPLWLKSW